MESAFQKVFIIVIFKRKSGRQQTFKECFNRDKIAFNSKGDKRIIMFPSGFIANYDTDKNVNQLC